MKFVLYELLLLKIFLNNNKLLIILTRNVLKSTTIFQKRYNLW